MNMRSDPNLPFHHTLCLEVLASRRLQISLNAHPLHNNHIPHAARNPHVHRVRPKPARVLEEVVRLPRRALPGCAAVGADLEVFDRLVGADDLHREPPGRGAALVVQDKGAVDAAGDKGVGGRDNAYAWVAQLGEGVDEEVQLGGGALRALVDDLGAYLA